MSRTATFTISLTEAPIVTSYISYATVAKSAVADQDFTPVQGSLTFAPGETTKTVSVPVLAVSDRDLVFNLKLSNAKKLTLYRYGAIGVATIAPDNALVALVNTAKTKKTAYEDAAAASTAADAAKAARKNELDAAQTAYNDAVTEQSAAGQELINANNSVSSANQNLTNCVVLAAMNSAYSALIIIAQAQLDGANAHRAVVQTRVNTANADVTAKQTVLTSATAAYNSAVTAASTATSTAATKKTEYETAKAAAAAGFVGSTSLVI